MEFETQWEHPLLAIQLSVQFGTRAGGEWVCMCLPLCFGFCSADVESVGEKTMDTGQPINL